MPKAPRSRSSIDWGAVRRDYENTDIAVRALARRFGIRSENAIRRKVHAEGWTRDIEAITARLTTRAVAMQHAAPPADRIEPEDGRPTDPDPPPPEHAPEEDPARRPARRTRPGAKTPVPIEGRTWTAADDHTEEDRPPEAARGVRKWSRGDEDSLPGDQDVRTAQELADIHARAISEQLRYGDHAVDVALVTLNHIRRLLGATDPEAIGEARARLTLLSPERETLAGIMKSAGELLERGIQVKRKALGMDHLKAPPGVGPGDPLGQVAIQEVQSLLSALDPEALRALRDVTLRASRLPPQITIQAEEEPA